MVSRHVVYTAGLVPIPLRVAGIIVAAGDLTVQEGDHGPWRLVDDPVPATLRSLYKAWRTEQANWRSLL